MAVAGTNRLLDAQYLPIGESSAPTSNASFTIDTDHEPFPFDGGYSPTYLDRPAWWKVKADVTGWIRLDTEQSTSTNNVDTVLVIWWKDPTTNTYEMIAEDDDHGAYQSTSTITFKAGAGATYYVQVLSYYPSAATTYVLRAVATIAATPSWQLSGATAPAPSDSFAGATTRTIGDGGSFSTTALTTEAGEPTGIYGTVAGAGETKSGWWTFTADKTGMAQIFSSRGHLALFTGTSLANLELIENRINMGGSCVIWPLLQAGTTYYLRWAGTSSVPSSVNTWLYQIIPASAHVIPWTDLAVQNDTTGPGAVVGGLNAVSDGSDATYLDIFGIPLPSPPYADDFKFEFGALPGVVKSQVLDFKMRHRGYAPAPADGGTTGPSAHFYNGLNTRYTYPVHCWRWKSDQILDRVVSMHSESGSWALMDPNMILGGSQSTVAPPNGWGRGTGNTQPDIWFYNAPNTKNVRITEAAWVVYTYDDTDVPVKPPDEEFLLTIAGQQEGTRVRRYEPYVG